MNSFVFPESGDLEDAVSCWMRRVSHSVKIDTFCRFSRNIRLFDQLKTEPSRFSCRRFVGGTDVYRAVCFSVIVVLILGGRNVPQGAV